MQIVFENDLTKEYMHYLMELIISKCNPLDTIHLTTCVRKPIEHKLIVENPIQLPITLDLTCNSNLLQFERIIKMEPNSEVRR